MKYITLVLGIILILLFCIKVLQLSLDMLGMYDWNLLMMIMGECTASQKTSCQTFMQQSKEFFADRIHQHVHQQDSRQDTPTCASMTLKSTYLWSKACTAHFIRVCIQEFCFPFLRGKYRVNLSVLDPRKCEYLKDYSLDFEHAYMTT